MRIAAYIFFLLGIVLTIFLIWFTYVFALKPSFERKWVQVPSPAEAFVSLKLGDSGEILAETEDGGLYEFSNSPEPAWRKVTEPSGQAVAGITCGPIEYSYYTSSPPPGQVKSQVSESCSYAEAGLYLEVALLENGEVWYLETFSSSYVQLAVIVLLPIGCLVDIVILGIGAIFMFIHLARKKSALPYSSVRS